MWCNATNAWPHCLRLQIGVINIDSTLFFDLDLVSDRNGITKLKVNQMKDLQLYKAIETARLNQLEHGVAVTAMERAELFADAVMWLVNGVKKLGTPSLHGARTKYQDRANEAVGL